MESYFAQTKSNGAFVKIIILEFHVPSKFVGRIIGKGGTSIEPLQQSTRTRISFAALPGDENYSVCKIKGAAFANESARTKILELIAKYTVEDGKSKKKEEERLRKIGGKPCSGKCTKLESDKCKSTKNPDVVALERATTTGEKGVNYDFNKTQTMERKKRKICPRCVNPYDGKYKMHICIAVGKLDLKHKISASNSMEMNLTVSKRMRKLNFKHNLKASDKSRSLEKPPRIIEPVNTQNNDSEQNTKGNLVDIVKPRKQKIVILSAKELRKKKASGQPQVKQIVATDDPVPHFYCGHEYCIHFNTSFPSRQKLDRHYKKEHSTQHSSKVNQEPGPPFQLSCQICSRNFPSHRTFTQHQRGTHKSNCQMTHSLDIHKKTALFREVGSKSYGYECSLCSDGLGLDVLDIISYRKLSLQHHKKYYCDKCDTILDSREGLVTHRRSHAKEVRCYKVKHPLCKSCTQTFDSMGELTQHIATGRSLCSRSTTCTCVDCMSTRSGGWIGVRNWNWNWFVPTTLNTKNYVETPILAILNNGRQLMIGPPTLASILTKMSSIQ